MSIAHLLEDFTAQAEGAPMRLLDEEALEEERLAAFEKGYGAGWEDALQAQGAYDHISPEERKEMGDLDPDYRYFR